MQTTLRLSDQSTQQRVLFMPVCYRTETSGKATKAWEASHTFQVQRGITETPQSPQEKK